LALFWHIFTHFTHRRTRGFSTLMHMYDVIFSQIDLKFGELVLQKFLNRFHAKMCIFALRARIRVRMMRARTCARAKF